MKRGRKPLKPEERKVYKTRSISGTPEELAKLEELANAANMTVSRYVMEALVYKNYKKPINKVYKIEYHHFDYSDGDHYYLDEEEYYTSAETAKLRRDNLEYIYSHRWDDDEEAEVIYTVEDRLDDGEYYEFEIKEVEVKDLTPEQLEKVKI